MEKFSWSYSYLLWGISWQNITLMLADAAQINYDEDSTNNTSTKLESTTDIINYINNKH